MATKPEAKEKENLIPAAPGEHFVGEEVPLGSSEPGKKAPSDKEEAKQEKKKLEY